MRYFKLQSRRYTARLSSNENGVFVERRSGVTLVEVLMALMIMSIGVSAVAVLFPISVLRSIQATQLTNGAIVKYNVETLLDTHPELIFDPDGDGNLNEHVRGVVNRNYIIDPVGFYTHFDDGNDGANGPDYTTSFGNDGSNPSPFPRFGGALRLTNGATTAAFGSPGRRALRLKALSFANQGDGWETQIDAQAGTLVPGGITLSSDLDLTAVPTLVNSLPGNGTGGYLIADPDLYRLVVFSDNGRFSQAFPLVAIDTSTNVAYYTEDINNNGNLDAGEDVNMNGVLNTRSLPTEFGGLASRVLLQSRKISDYNWMLSVRRRSDGFARRVDVVVRFNDGVSVADERLYQATFIPNSQNVWVRLPSRVNAADTTEPNIRKGKFIFDAVNGMWYRIQDVREAPVFPSGSFLDFDYLVTVQEPIRAADGSGALTPAGAPAAAGPYGWAMFPAGVVDVYPMGSRAVPASLQSTAF